MRLRGHCIAGWLVGLIAATNLEAGAARGAAPAGAPYTPYQQQAWYIYLISQYSQWPDAAFAATNAPFILGILGQDPFGNSLDLIKGKPVRNHPLQVRHFNRADDIDSCHALYVGASEEERLPEILKAVRQRPILTFGESHRFLELGGVVELWVRQETSEKGYLYFEINPDAAARAELRISAYVLKLARPRPPHPKSP